ncbi:MAG: hypothetical protein ACUZ8O_11720 [Candidatus Anammoxibacter sp.]
MDVNETGNTGPEWVEDDGSGMTCIDCNFMATSKSCGGSEKYMCEKHNFLLSSDINKKCKDFEER